MKTLPVIVVNNTTYFVDSRLSEMRDTNDPQIVVPLPRLKMQEIPYEAGGSCYRFRPSSVKPFVTTNGAGVTYGPHVIHACLAILQQAADEHNGRLKHVISEDRNYLMSGGIGVSLPTASDVTGNLAHVNYEVQNDTLNLIPFIAILFSPRNDVFIQLHSQIDVPIGNDNFAFTEQPLPCYTAQSGTFGSYRESVLASMDIQTGCRLFSNPHSRSIRGVTAIVELRYTAALNDSSGAAGQAGEFYGDPATQVSAQLSQTSNRQDYLNMTFGIQLDIRNDWHLRCGQVFPLIDSNSFTAETLLQLERRF